MEIDYVVLFFLSQAEDACGQRAAQGFYLHVFAHTYSCILERAADGGESQLRLVVLLTEVAQPYVLEAVGKVRSQGLCTLHVAQVAMSVPDAVFEIAWIGTSLEHLRVVVGLYYQVVGTAYELLHLVGNGAYIREKTEYNTVSLNQITHIVGAVVRHVKGSDMEVAHVETLSLHNLHTVGLGELAAHAVVAVHAGMNRPRSVDRQIELLAQASHRLDVVGMVVSDENAVETVHKPQSVIMKRLLERPRSYANINKQTRILCVYVVAVAATSASKRYEIQHFFFYKH